MANNITTIKFDNNEYSLRPYGVCSTAAATATKAVSITGFTLFTGATVLVKFNNTNTATNPKLNINSTGAKSIKHGSEDVSLVAGTTYEFIYDGTNWEMVGSDHKALKEKLDTTLINGGVINLSSTGDVESVYESLKDNGVAICIIGDSKGNYPSREKTPETRINVNSKYCDAFSYFFSTNPRGASVGDLLLVSKQKYLGINICALKIIPINDAKVAIDGKYNGVEGIVTVGDKERINKIDGIEWTANNVRDNYLPKSDFLPSFWPEHGEILNMDQCLETGVYVWCEMGEFGKMPDDLDDLDGVAYTCITIKSSTPDNGGFYTHNQICLGRSGSKNGQMYQRLVFTNPTTGATDFGYTWKRIDNIDTAVNLARGEKGSIPYQTEENRTAFLSAGTNGQVLKMGSNGLPTWSSDNNTDTNVKQTEKTDNVSYPLLLSPTSHTSGNAGEAYYDKGVTLNPSTNTIAANISGVAAKATSDANGNNIVNTYATKALATTSTDGLMSADMVKKIKNIQLDQSKTYLALPLLQEDPETQTLIPSLQNDIAYPIARGGSISITRTTSSGTSTVIESNDNICNGFPDMFTINSLSSTTSDSIVIEIDTNKNLTYGQYFYLTFTSSQWRAKNVKVEVKGEENSVNKNWVTLLEVTDFSSSILTEKFPTASENGYRYIKITLKNFNGNSCRIADIGVVSYNSNGLLNSVLPRGGGSVYGSITPSKNSTYNLGSSSYKWNNIYGNLNGNISGGAKGSIPYQSAANTTAFLTAGTDGQVLKMGSSGIPVWSSDNNTDTKVKQTYTGSTNEFPLLLSPNGHTSGNAGEAYYDTGVTLNPSTDTLTTKIKLKTSAGKWASGRTQAAMDYKLSDGIGTTSYHSILGVKSGSGNVVNIGGLADDFGFYGWNSDAVAKEAGEQENVLPTWSFKFNTATGNVTASGTVVAASFKEGNTFLSDKYVLKANMTDATTAEIEALFN